MAVARLVYFRMPGGKIWGIKASRMTVLFVWLDIIVFIVQAAGGVMLSSSDSDVKITKIGMTIYMAGVGTQLSIVIIFGVMVGFFYRRLWKMEGREMGRIKYLIWIMLAVLGLIIVSCSCHFEKRISNISTR